MRLRPVLDLVIIKRHDAPTRTKGGIHIPDRVERENDGPLTGEVLAVGPGRLTEHGAMIVPTVHAGHVVLFRRYSGHMVEVDGEEYLLVPCQDILGIIEGAGAS